jgi:hypothetical protein
MLGEEEPSAGQNRWVEARQAWDQCPPRLVWVDTHCANRFHSFARYGAGAGAVAIGANAFKKYTAIPIARTRSMTTATFINPP